MAARAALIAVGPLLLLVAAPTGAHRLAPSLLELREEAGGRVALTWKQSRFQPARALMRPELPPHCRLEAAPGAVADAVSVRFSGTADCGARGLVGARIGVTGLGESGGAALLRLELADGRRLRTVLDGGRPVFVVPVRESRLAVAAGYGCLGIGHILTGADHALFLLALLLLLPGRRALLLAVTAFTVGHSVTLSLAALGLVGVPPDLAELAIAASLLVLAVELTKSPGASRLRRRPWEAAALFGLVHGLGFAGALTEAGLPQGEVPLALASFNLGIELGQLALLAGAWLLRPALLRLSPAPAYAMGSLAAFWCLSRLPPWL